MKHAGGDGGGATRALLLSMLFSCDVDDTSLSLSKHRPDSAGSADEVTDDNDDDTYQSFECHLLHPRASSQPENRQGARRGGGLDRRLRALVGSDQFTRC
jgi:hypothetical protein